MVKYIECYPEYQKFEEFIKCLIRILKLSCIPWKVLHGKGKYIFPIFELYCLISSVLSLVYFKKNLMVLLMRVIISFGYFQIITKSLSVLVQANKFKILFEFIQELHEVHETDSIVDFAKIHLLHLKKSLDITKIILRILFAVSFITSSGLCFYSFHTDAIIMAIPGVLPDPNASPYYLHIHQVFCMEASLLVFSISDVILISTGFYLIAVLNIFQNLIENFWKFEGSNKEVALIQLHKLHCNILDKFRTFSEIFYYTITVQTGTSAVFVLCIFFLMLSSDFAAFIPLCLLVFGQFGAICIFGELMYSKTEKLTTELYLTNWYEFGLKEQKILLMMMHMSQKIIGIKAAGMYDINLRMFIDVIKGGISFLTILYTIA
uniref:Odorant receptor n=1 Tax=Phlebotomus papatasi TaxID=29031 RepID=A0A3F2ZEA2_PHLPP